MALVAGREAPVLYSVTDGVAEITLNRPDNRNSMTPDVLAAFAKAVNAVKTDKAVRCLIITARGSSFCAGADFRKGTGLAEAEWVSPFERSMHRVSKLGPNTAIPTIPC